MKIKCPICEDKGYHYPKDLLEVCEEHLKAFEYGRRDFMLDIMEVTILPAKTCEEMLEKLRVQEALLSKLIDTLGE